MAFSVNEFRAQMQGDGARPNLFEVSMPFPAFAAPGNSQTKLTFMCKTAALPGSTVGTVPVTYFGRELKFVGNRSFQDWTITIINDEDFRLRDAFEKWMHGLNSHVTNTRAAAFQNALGYQQNATVTQYGKNGQPIKMYDFIGMFPIDVSPIELDWGSNDAIEEFGVTLAYQFWESDTTS